MANAVIQGIVLELTQEESKFLSALMSLVGGDPENSLRKYSDEIGRALAEAVGSYTFSVESTSHLREISFTENSTIKAILPLE
jgi:hypothetical protein